MRKFGRKCMSALLALVLLASLLPFGAAPAQAAGGKTIVIATPDQLRKFAEDVSAHDDEVVNANVYLTHDINLENESWTPVGILLSRGPGGLDEIARKTSFNGTFDGQGHTIYGLNIDSIPGAAENIGFIASLGSSGTVKNLNVTGSVGGNNSNVGGIVGANNGGTVTNCTFATANIYTAGVSPRVSGSGKNSNVGGVVGLNSGTVTDCFFTDSAFVSIPNVTATVSGGGNNSNVGGVVGLNSGTVANCGSTNKGNVSSSGGNSNIGGIVGNNSGSVTACTNAGNLSGSGNTGGLVGANSGTVTACTNAAGLSVSSSDSGNFGGAVGLNNRIVENCTNNGSISFTTGGGVINSTFGGVVGRSAANSSVTNCSNTGTIGNTTHPLIGAQGTFGGIVGSNTGNSSVTNCYTTGGFGSFLFGTVGRVVGTNENSSVTNCYYLTGTASAGIGSNSGSGDATATEKDGNAFHSGEIAYLLQKGQTEPVWGQDLSKTDSWPTLIALNGSVQPVYKVTVDYGDYTGAPATVTSYTNDTTEPTAPADREGYIFGGWERTEGEGNTITYTAQWLPYTYSIGVSPATLDFGSITEGEERPAAQEVTITNTGNQTVTLNQPTAENFEIGELSAKTLKPDETATFTVQPKSDLSAGGYSEQIAITGDNNASTTLTASFSVKEPPYTGKYSYEVTTSVGAGGTISVDRYATEGDKVTIKVTPDEAYLLEDLTITSGGRDVEVTAGGDGTYSFTMPSGDVKITATFAEDPDWTEPEEPTTDVSAIFLDVAPNAWYKDAVQYAYDNGLMTGVSDTEFAPEQTTTRAETCSILARLENVTSAESAGFADVDDEWYATAVNWAASVGVVSGTGEGNFSPNAAITREQLAAMLMNYSAWKGEDVSARADLTTYSDQPSAWAEESISWSVAEGLISGVTADTLQPQGNATRAQVAAILARYLGA